MRVTARELAAPRRRTPLPRRERDVQAAILKALRLMPGVVAWKTGGGLLPVNGRRVRMGHKGVSDIIGWKQERGEWQSTTRPLVSQYVPVARFLAIEVKAKGKQPTDEQRAFLDAVKSAGGIAIVAYEVSDMLAALR